MAAPGSGKIVIVKRDGTEGSNYPLIIGSLTIGSGKDCDIIISTKGFPQKQCIITVHPTEATIENLSSENPIFINNKKVDFSVLTHKDIISFGNAKFRWDYSNKGTPNNKSTRKSFRSQKRTSVIVKHTRNSIGRRKSESNIRKSIRPLEIRGRNSSASLPGLRQVAVVKPQRRSSNIVDKVKTSITGSSQQSKNKSEGTHSLGKTPEMYPKHSSSTGKKRKVEKLESESVVLDKNKRAALMLLTRRSSPHQTMLKNLNSTVTPKTFKRRSVHFPLHQHNVSGILPIVEEVTNSPDLFIPETPNPRIIGQKIYNTKQSEKSLSVPSKSRPTNSAINGRGKSRLFNSEVNSASKSSTSSAKLKSVSSTPKTVQISNGKSSTSIRNSSTLSRTRRSLALKTPISSNEVKKLPLTSISKRKNKSVESNSTLSEKLPDTNDGSPVLSLLSSIKMALNIINSSDIDLEVVRETPEFRAISDKIKSVEKLVENNPLSESPNPQILEIGRVSRLSKRFSVNSPKANTTCNNETTPQIVFSQSPIISPKHRSPELLNSTTNYIDINTPNLSKVFELKSSTPMDIQKNLKHDRNSLKTRSYRVSCGSFNTKKNEILNAKSKTEPRRISARTSNKSDIFKSQISGGSPSDTLFNGSILNTSKNNELTITPKSTLKPPPEVLKEKHSTAKKPVSKKSIIDHLTRSPEIAKELFKSPVKRILSQSMRHYNSSSSLDDDDRNAFVSSQELSFELLTRSKRNSKIGSFNTTDKKINTTVPRIHKANDSLLKSQNGPGVIRSTRSQKSPLNDLTDVRGVRRLLRTPAKLNNVNKNSSFDLRGVKKLFNTSSNIGKSPKNDLRDVRGVKKIFKTSTKVEKSPKNDLTNVRGVKRVFRSPQRSPINDITNVTGIKELFSPNNKTSTVNQKLEVKRNLRNSKNNVSNLNILKTPPVNMKSFNSSKNLRGVGALFKTPKKNSPKNDLTDVKGVRRLLQTPRKTKRVSLNNSIDLSGLRQMFESSDLRESGKKNTRNTSQRQSIPEKRLEDSPKDDVKYNESVLENVGLIPNSFYKKIKADQSMNEKSASGSFNRSRRQTTIDKTSFSLEISKVAVPTPKKKSPEKNNTSMLGHSTPAIKTKTEIESKINIKQISPISMNLSSSSPPIAVKKSLRNQPKAENDVKVSPKVTRNKAQQSGNKNVKKENGAQTDSSSANLHKIKKTITKGRTRAASSKKIVVNESFKISDIATVIKKESAIGNKNSGAIKTEGSKKKVTFALGIVTPLDTPKGSRTTRRNTETATTSNLLSSKRTIKKPVAIVKTEKKGKTVALKFKTVKTSPKVKVVLASKVKKESVAKPKSSANKKEVVPKKKPVVKKETAPKKQPVVKKETVPKKVSVTKKESVIKKQPVAKKASVTKKESVTKKVSVSKKESASKKAKTSPVKAKVSIKTKKETAAKDNKKVVTKEKAKKVDKTSPKKSPIVKKTTRSTRSKK